VNTDDLLLHVDPLLERLLQRRSAKWQTHPRDVLPLTVAEMDFALAPAVSAAQLSGRTRVTPWRPHPGGRRGHRRPTRPSCRLRHPEQIGDYLGFLGGFWGFDGPASARVTLDLLGWEPTRPGLIADLKQGHYFA
jgi:hypothetical protein